MFLTRLGIPKLWREDPDVLWPVLRGLPWRQVREDIGWTLGRNPGVEPAIGLGCYIMALPIVAVGFLLTWLLFVMQSDVLGLNWLGEVPLGGHWVGQQVPTHPIVEYVV